MERISTGVSGLDIMLNGGLLPGRVYLIKGGPGTGKSTLAMHFAMDGVRNGEKVLYITLEEPVETLKEDMRKFGFDVDNPLLTLVEATPVGTKRSIFDNVHYDEFARDFSRFLKKIVEKFSSGEFSRVIVDPITMLRLTLPDELEYRRSVITLVKEAIRNGVTLLLIAETTSQELEDYLVHGVIELRKTYIAGEPMRIISIVKFRGSSFDEALRHYEITDRGIVVYHTESVMIE
ncbi:MAG: ATP-binding protein [Thermococci archaeon]|nr:ATP-binding protein [Thermococci archaeon]